MTTCGYRNKNISGKSQGSDFKILRGNFSVMEITVKHKHGCCEEQHTVG